MRRETMRSYQKVFLRFNVAVLVAAGAWQTALAAVRAYIPVQGTNSVKVIGTASGAVIANIKVGNKPTGVAVDSHHAVVYVSNLADDTVSAINAANNTVFATIHTGKGPYGLAVAPDGSTVYVAESGDNTLGYFTALTPPATNNSTIAVSLVLHIPVGTTPKGVVVTPDGKSVAITNYGGNNVSIFDRASQKVVATV